MTISAFCAKQSRPLVLLWLSATFFQFSFAQVPNPAGSPLIQVQRVDHIDEPTREPAIIEAPDGTLFVTGYGSRDFKEQLQRVPRLWKSTDRGASWERVNVGGEKDGALADSDVSLAVAPDGTIYFASMEFDVKAMEGVHIVVGVSQDAGGNWKWQMLSEKRLDDRPWVAVAPDGTAHVIWNDGSGVYHRASRDRGLSWSETQMIASEGGSSYLTAGPGGGVAVRLTPMSASGNKYTEGIDFISVSMDGGLTWQEHPAPGQRDWAPMGTQGAVPRWVEPLAWDARGNLYSLWTNFRGIWLAQSGDHGATWKTYKIADADALSYYPDLTVGSSGKLTATWFAGAGESLRWHTGLIDLGEGGEPRVKISEAMPIESWTEADEPDHVLVRTSAGEYLQPIFLKDGSVGVVSPIQDQKNNRYGFTFWRFQAK